MLRLHDSATRKSQLLTPLADGRVTMYNCGPTVYDYVHIGNLRSFLLADLLRRVLDDRGLAVTQIMNITDVGHMLADADEGEDKMDVAAAKAGKTPQQVAAFYTEAFFRDIDRIGIRRATHYPKASEHVTEMIAMIGELLANGHAYKVGTDGAASVYFDVSTFPAYGKLSGNTVEALDAGARIEVRTEKRNPADFALWIHNPNHLLQWQAPWGSGYPGWHIECSAMATKYLGESIDIHTGGEDNKFPHHECEIAQSEGASGKQFVRTWLHATHLMVNGEKMSKSKGNFFTLQDLLDKGYAARTVRYALIAAHYRSSLNFTLEGLDGAANALARIDDCADAVRAYVAKEPGTPSEFVAGYRKKFDEALDDDLNVSQALATLFEFVTATNAAMANGSLKEACRANAEEYFSQVGDILGFTFGRATSDADVPASVLALIAKRDEARKEKRYAESDQIRDQLKELGYSVEDTPEGRRIKRI